ncbi:glycosyl hydrolase family 8 [Streptomyces zagrosensis]|uniref:Endo-1,4-beta-D-glucanase Y n=1 Tax=Streptomyces zagrosensis TaxID=1042984 RepID=A0A7W9Q952_9ACTN|nr:glycosyl hydrolase family 8 [Streptomyces zagrosensis]MBB5935826.1 endo-1,4-beta-D-glucanase Y [Streptomyces zagrosensis]
MAKVRNRGTLAVFTAVTLAGGGGLWLAGVPSSHAAPAAPASAASPAAAPTDVGPRTQAAPAIPFGSHSFSYAKGTLSPSGDRQANDAKVASFYKKWKANFVKQNCGNGWYQVYSPDADHAYVGEAQGYGMVITATMAGADADAQQIFDGLLKYVLAHPSSINKDLHAAEQNESCKSVNGTDSATDGDLDIAYGLLLADRQWGSSGAYDYKALAVKRINAIKKSELHSGTKLLKLGDWSSGDDDKISRTSDWMAGHFRAFKKATGDTTWDAVRTKTQQVIADLQDKHAPKTGLLPDFVVNTTSTPKPASGKVLEDENDGDYDWNACRDPWRIGTDAALHGDGASKKAAGKLSSWAESKTGGNPSKILNGYRLNGSAYGDGNDAAFFAPFAVAAMTDGDGQAWLDALWKKLAATSPSSGDYYSASVQLQSMLVVTHNFWTP